VQPETGDARRGAGDKCPVCGSLSGVVADDEGFICLVCGAPRVLVTDPIARPGGERRWLEQAKALRLRRAGWTIAASTAIVVIATALVVGGLLQFLVHFGDVGRTVWGTLVLVPALFAALAYRNAARASDAAKSALGEAEVVIAEELVKAHGPIEAPALAASLGVPLERAETLLGRAQIDRMLEPEEPARLRVDAAESDSEDAARTKNERERS
jgi:hypothetical protein